LNTICDHGRGIAANSRLRSRREKDGKLACNGFDRELHKKSEDTN